MLFNSYVFVLIFLPVMLAGWWYLPTRTQRLAFLTGMSYVFYGWWDWRFVPLMLAASTADYVAGLAISRTENDRHRKGILAALLAFNLGLLGIFKYYDFFVSNLNALLPGDPMLPLLKVVLPVGISFYTFNSISYTIDVYRRKIPPARTLLEFSAFVAMFPHLVAGPIVRYADMASQFARLPGMPSTGERVTGLSIAILGLAKKVLIADPIAAGFVHPLFDGTSSLGLETAWLATIGYTMQIYFDFSAYSDMAVGLALLLGIRFPQNFDSPYKARNISEFWRKWHMSLSFWLRDYLFISMGGSRGTALRTMRNLLITMLLGGLWHGAAWTFVLWGLYHGALLAGHSVFRSRGWTPRSSAVATAATFVSVMFGWVLFRAPTLPDAVAIFRAMFGFAGRADPAQLSGLMSQPATLVLGAALVAVFALPNTWEFRLPRTRMTAVALASLLIVCVLRFANPSPFLYFQF